MSSDVVVHEGSGLRCNKDCMDKEQQGVAHLHSVNEGTTKGDPQRSRVY